MRLPNLTLLSITLFALSAAAQQINTDTEASTTNSLQSQDANTDDTSLFRGVENAIDEDSEEDAYRILKSLQDSTEEGYAEEEEEEEEEEIDHSSSKEIRERIQPEENDPVEEEEDTIVEVEIDDDEEEDGEEEDDEDFSADAFLPDFKNEATQDFFQHLPQQQQPAIIKEGLTEPIEEEEADEDVIVNSHNDIHDEEGYDDLFEEEKNNIPAAAAGANDLPVLPPTTTTTTAENYILQQTPLINDIPWHRPDKIVENNNKFYQDTNSIRQQKQVIKKPRAGFTFWHALFISVVLVIIYNKLNCSSVVANRKKVKEHKHCSFLSVILNPLFFLL
jgi:hypothetical protein